MRPRWVSVCLRDAFVYRLGAPKRRACYSIHYWGWVQKFRAVGMISWRSLLGTRTAPLVLVAMLAGTSLASTTTETAYSARSVEHTAERLQQEAQDSADWTIDPETRGDSPLFAGGCTGNFIGPQVESNGAEILYGGRQACSAPVDQRLTFRLQRCLRTGICVRFTTVDEISRTRVVQAFTVTAQPACQSTQTNTYRVEVDAMARGVTARTISD